MGIPPNIGNPHIDPYRGTFRFLTTFTVRNQDTYESRDQVATDSREGHNRGCMCRLQFLKSGQRIWSSHSIRL